VAERRARQQLQGFLLRHGRIYGGRTSWGRTHRRWLATLDFALPAHRVVALDLIAAVEAAGARRARLEADILRLLPDWSLLPVIEAWQALRGISTIAAIVLAAELGDLTRFASARQLMAYLGLVPSEHSTGDKRRQGGITKAGNRHARRILVEGAWSYRLPARVSRAKLRTLEPLPKPVRDIAEKAQQRLCPRYRRLLAKGRPANLVTVAIAREMAAFLWAIAKVTPPAGTAPPNA
jgi:transposase